MSYQLLTGASGLLGSYLLRDNLLNGQDMAVLVRPTPRQSANERVEAMLAQWEKQLRCKMPRPHVLSGDLHHPNLDLNEADLRWIRRNCESIIHNAASLSFIGPNRRGEPWRTNVDGTRYILDLCQECGISNVHYISTAYVCGQRSGRILETELDVGQDLGNDYERSKVQAEKEVMQADLKNPATIYRPSIIVGDSHTGYTSTFHGFFAFVRLAHTLASQILRGTTQAQLLLKAFHMKAQDCKNLVPVDWVSAVITHILGRREHHGRTYHLTAHQPTPMADLSRAIHDAVQRYSPFALVAAGANDASWFEETYRQQAEIYRSYWRDDPQFDNTHTQKAAPHLPCPTVDYQRLMCMARFAIQTRFGKGRNRLPLLNWVLGNTVRRFIQPQINAQLHLASRAQTPKSMASCDREGASHETITPPRAL